MPKNVKRALIVFCVVGVLALLTDGILLALSINRHHAVTTTTQMPGSVPYQRVASPESGSAYPTPTSNETQVSLLSLSAQHLAFNATQGQTTLAPQTLTLAATPLGFSWRTDPVNILAPWIHLSAWQGRAEPDTPVSFTVSVRPAGLAAGLYTTSMLVKAIDTQGKILTGSPMTLVVTLNIHPPCAVSVTPDKLSFASVLASEPPPQTLTLGISGSCALPVSWQASADASWVSFVYSSGTSTTSKAIVVQTSVTGKLIGTYTAHITLQGTDSSGMPLIFSPAEITVTLTVIA
jgi:hypothetical protein